MSSRIGSQLGAPFAAAFLFCLLISPAARGQDGWNVTRVGQLSYWGAADKVVVDGSYAYVVSDYPGFLHILDISNPQTPLETGFLEVSDRPRNLAVAAGYVYLAADDGGLQIVDVSDPLQPTPVAVCTLGQWTREVAVAGDYAYVLDDTELYVIDVSDPASPTILGSCSLIGSGQGLAVSGNFVYAGAWGELWAIDVSDPTAPEIVESCPVYGTIMDVVISGNYAYTVGYWGLRIVDISDPGNPVEAGHHVLISSAQAIGLWGDYAYATLGQYLAILDISDPLSPTIVAYLPQENWAADLAISQGLAYLVRSATPGLDILSLANPVQPELQGSLRSVGYPHCVDLQGGYAFVVASDGLQILDVTTPASPQQVGFWDNDEYWQTIVAVADSYAYLPTESNLMVLNVSDPTNPTLMNTGLSSWGGYNATDIKVAGNLCYVLSGYWSDGQLRVWDVSDPTMPVDTAYLSLPGDARGLDLYGNYAYVATGAYGLRVLDISNPDTLIEAGLCYTPDWANDVAIAGDYAYIACWYDGLRIADISNPTAPVLRGHLNLPDPALSLQVLGQHAFVACGTGLSVVNIANPDNPYLVGSHEASGYAHSLAVADNYAYVVEGGFLSIYDCSEAVPVEPFNPSKTVTTFELLPAFPNPFNATSVTSYGLRVPSHVSLRVYDTAGKLVATLVNEWKPTGMHQATFDGSDLPSGIYLAKLTAGDFSAVQKLVLLK